MVTQYIVMKRGYEYNDSTYDLEEGGIPQRIFQDKNLAEQKSEELNITFWMNESRSLRMFNYSIRSVFNHGAEEKWRELFGEELDFKDFQIDFPIGVTKEQVRDFLPFLTDNLYYVFEVVD